MPSFTAHPLLPLLLTLLSSSNNNVIAYSFNFKTTPSQCGPLTIAITGSGGQAPYRLSIVPWGGSPVNGGQTELRKILDFQFNDSSQISFPLPYPKNSQFVAIVSRPLSSHSRHFHPH